MEIIIINRALSKDEEHDILGKLISGSLNFHLFNNVTLSDKLEVYSKGAIELSPDEKKAINYEIFDQVLKFGEIKIRETAITDMLMFEKASIWHYHKFRTYFFIRNLAFEIRLIEKLSQEYQKITYYGEYTFLKKYPFNFPGLTINIPKAKKSKVNYRTVFNYILFFKLRVLAGFLQLFRNRKTKHLVIDHSLKQTILNIYTLKPEQGNYYLEYLFENLDHDFVILDEVDIPKFQKGIEFKLKKWYFYPRGRRLFGEIILFKGLFSTSVKKQQKANVLQLSGKYKLIRSGLDNPINLLIIDFIESLHASSKFFLFKYFAYQKFFGHHPYKTISTIDENSPRIKTILDAAKSNGIKTIGIQHGTIHDLHPAYMFTEKDAKRKLVSDFTLIWGENWKKLLTEKGNYNPGSLIITGQVRTDIIHRLQDRKPNDLIEIPTASKIILFASQPQQDPELREKSALDVFTSVKNIPNVHLVVKLHPAEFNDFDYYHALARKSGCSNYQIVLQVDLYLLISLSDIVITCFSTVGAETVYFNKPLIILDHLKQDIQGYIKEGIAFQAVNQVELREFIVKILNNQLSHKSEFYENYIRNYAYSVDGQVSERIISFIKKDKIN